MEPNENGIRLLAAAVLRTAYCDLAEGLAITLAELNQDYSDPVRKKVEKIDAAMNRGATTILRQMMRKTQWKDYTDEDFEAIKAEYTRKWKNRKLKDMRTARTFLESDRAEMFAESFDPKSLVQAAEENVRQWADGKRKTYLLIKPKTEEEETD